MSLVEIDLDHMRGIQAQLLRHDFRRFCEAALAPLEQAPARHHLFLINELQAVADGECDRLMVFMPPGHAKSTYASVLFPAWFMARGRQDLIGASHGAEFAEDLSGKVLRLVRDMSPILGYGLASENTKMWRTTNGCNYRAAGAGGAITGRRADLLLIDDPIKGREDADSETVREKTWAWYRADAVTRLKPRGRIVLIQTRWHQADLSGILLDEMQAGGDRWRVINLPAIAEADDDPIGRELGEALWPEQYDLAELARRRAIVGERDWAALYQQRPRPTDGSIFKTDQIGVVDGVAAGQGFEFRAWDLAATAKTGTRDPDWTVGVKLLRTQDARFIVTDIVRLRGGPDEVERAIVATASQDGSRVRIGLPEDPGQAGKAQVLYLTRKLAGYAVSSSRETGDKVTRAMPVAAQCNVGNVLMLRAPWNRAFLEELAGFPSAAHDDQVDALSRAFGAIGMTSQMRISPDAVRSSMRRIG